MKTVLIEMDGRLGNQMFLYAFYKKMCKVYPDIQFKMDISTVYAKQYEGGLELTQVFPNVKMSIASKKEILRIEKKHTFKYRGRGSGIIQRITENINKKNRLKIKKYIATEEALGDQLFSITDWNNISFFSGFWQKIDYYEDILVALREDLAFRDFDDVADIKLANDIKCNNSVSVHIRRGDYVGEILDILDVDYYKSIIETINKEIKDPVFYFFSDDIEYIEENFKDVKKIIVNNKRDLLTNYRDMQLMSLCKHNIIANSTFSIWAALLNRNNERKVYYPDMFTREEKMQQIKLPGFIQVKTNLFMEKKWLV